MAIEKKDVKIAIITGLAIGIAALVIRSYAKSIERKG